MYSSGSSKNNCSCMGRVILLSNHITQIPIFFSVFQQDWLKPRASCSNLKPSQGACAPTGHCWGTHCLAAAAACFRWFLIPSLPVPNKWKSLLFARSFITSHYPFKQLSFSYQPPVHFWHGSGCTSYPLTSCISVLLPAILFFPSQVQAPIYHQLVTERVGYTGVSQLYWGPPSLAMPAVQLVNT